MCLSFLCVIYSEHQPSSSTQPRRTRNIIIYHKSTLFNSTNLAIKPFITRSLRVHQLSSSRLRQPHNTLLLKPNLGGIAGYSAVSVPIQPDSPKPIFRRSPTTKGFLRMNEATSSNSILEKKPPVPPAKPDRSQISFYQRQLPDGCIPFTSEAGKSLFRQALDSGHLEAFFPLSSQLVTQHEPSFCGLASLCTVLNALGVDPRRVWKHPWRWYEQDMLDCCRPLEAVQRVGITLSEFNCLARCNGLRVYSSYPQLSNQSNHSSGISLEQFRTQVEESTRTSSSFMVASFSRSALGQTGDGHFSPIAGYDPTTERVLVLDVARFKYPSYWVKLEDLYNAMRPVDSATGLPRGFSVLSSAGPSIDMESRSATTLALNKSSWATVNRHLRTNLDAVKNVTEAAVAIVHILSVIENECPTGAVEVRSGMKPKADHLLDSIRQSSIGIALSTSGYTINGPNVLLTLALFGGRASSARSSLLPVELRDKVEKLVTSAVNDELGVEVHQELDILAQQISALRECCAIESGEPEAGTSGKGVCACAEKNK